MNTIKSLSIILPTLNEYTNLKILIPQIIIEMNQFSELQYEILVVDDNSDDDTENLIHDFSVTNSNIKFIKRTNPPSLPMSIWEGINNSKSDYVVWLDADGSMPPTTISNLIKKQSQNKESVVIASRFVAGGGYKGIEEAGKTSFFTAMYNVYKSKDSVLATILSKIFNNILYRVLPGNVKDVTSGFIMGKKNYFYIDTFRRAAYGDYFLYLITNLNQKNINIIEVGYLCETRLHGNSKTGSNIFQLIKRGFPYIIASLKCRIS